MFLFERPKRNRKSRHRSESVDDGSGALPPTPPPEISGRPSRRPLLPALPCRPGETVLLLRAGWQRFGCVGVNGNAFFFGKTLLYTIRVESNHTSHVEQGYMKLFIPCGGADTPRPIKLRQKGSDGKWFLWEQYLLPGVRIPKAADPWA